MSLTLLFAESFDIVDGNKSTLKYSVLNIGFFGVRILTGYKSVGALSIDNTSGTTPQLTRSFGATSTLLWNAHFQVNPSSSQVFLILGAAAGPTPLLQVRSNTDGTLDLLNGAGSVLASTLAISFSTTYWLEVNCSYGISAEIEVWLGLAGATPTRVIHLTGINLGATLPDQFTFQWVSSGSPHSLWLDNITVWQADALSDRNGPSAVTGEIAAKLISSGGWTKAGTNATGVLQAIADTFTGYTTVPDGNLSYDVTGTGALMTNVASPCFGLVLAVALNLCANPAGGSPTITGVVNERAGVVNLGSATVVDTTNTLVPGTPALFGFATYQFISQQNAEATNWNDLQISTAQWGAEGSGVLWLTQLYLEKVTDLTGRKFGCGAASYTF